MAEGAPARAIRESIRVLVVGVVRAAPSAAGLDARERIRLDGRGGEVFGVTLQIPSDRNAS